MTSRRVEELESTLRKVVPALREAGVPFLLAGGAACFAYGGPPPERDIDIFVAPESADQVLEALAAAGLQTERPPEEWLVKAWDGDILVDVIFAPAGLEVTDELLGRGRMIPVAAMRIAVMSLEDLFISKLLSLDEHHADYSVLLLMGRAVREQVDWAEVHARTHHSPLAMAFFTMMEQLRLMPALHGERRTHVTVIGSPATGGSGTA
jgi:predicted nucleotidyltransferase